MDAGDRSLRYDFYTGKQFEQWTGDVLVGGLVAEAVVRLEQNGDQLTEVERIGLDARIRDVVQGPDGTVYVLTDQTNGEILRLTPAQE